jgi:hypothetical protein
MPGREKRKRSRKQRARRAGGAGNDSDSSLAGRIGSSEGPGSDKSRDDLAREALAPLEEGERPRAVTVAAVVAALLGLSNVVGVMAGIEVGGEKPDAGAVILPTVLMFVAAVGMWYARYWAVLGFQTILAFLIILLSVLLVKAETMVQVLLLVVVIGAAGTMFWFLVKSLARIQMPSGRG